MIFAYTFLHQGTIEANGLPTPLMTNINTNTNGGSGGYIYINISTPFGGSLTSNAVIQANGGMGVLNGVAGSGGRIVVRNFLLNAYPNQVQAFGGYNT